MQRIGDRTLKGRLDAVVDTPDAMIVIDHKSYPGGRAQWIEQARKYAGQLRNYSDAVVSVAAPRPVTVALHLPVSGTVLFVE